MAGQFLARAVQSRPAPTHGRLHRVGLVLWSLRIDQEAYGCKQECLCEPEWPNAYLRRAERHLVRSLVDPQLCDFVR